jgi:hypothetical protein
LNRYRKIYDSTDIELKYFLPPKKCYYDLRNSGLGSGIPDTGCGKNLSLIPDPGPYVCHLLCLAPDVEVGVDEHHDGADGAAGLEEQDPRAIEEEEHGEAELHAVPERADVVDPVVQRFPQPVLHRIFFILHPFILWFFHNPNVVHF